MKIQVGRSVGAKNSCRLFILLILVFASRFTCSGVTNKNIKDQHKPAKNRIIRADQNVQQSEPSAASEATICKVSAELRSSYCEGKLEVGADGVLSYLLTLARLPRSINRRWIRSHPVTQEVFICAPKGADSTKMVERFGSVPQVDFRGTAVPGISFLVSFSQSGCRITEPREQMCPPPPVI